MMIKELIEMKMWIDTSPYWLTPEGVSKVQALKDATHLGHWCIKQTFGGWAESPVDVFHVSNPDTSKGHTNYFGLFYRGDKLFICEASTAFSEPITGVLADDGEVIVSRYRHDFQQRKGVMIDGGRDYIRSSSPVQLVKVIVEGSVFRFELLNSGLPIKDLPVDSRT